MKKINIKKNNKLFLKNVIYLGSYFSKMVGMMFFKKGTYLLNSDEESIPYTTIHTALCLPLLVAWVNSKNKVVDIKKTKPWHIYAPKAPAKYVLETTNFSTKIKIGDKITFKNIISK